MNNALTVIVLIVAVLCTGLGLVYSKHQSRKSFIDLQILQAQRDDLEIEWGLLQLEQSTVATEAEVDHAARTRLDMIIPATDAVIYVMR